MAGPTPYKKFRIDDDLWERFSSAVDRSPDGELDMSKALRQFVRWFVGEPGAQLPQRPTVPERTDPSIEAMRHHQDARAAARSERPTHPA